MSQQSGVPAGTKYAKVTAIPRMKKHLSASLMVMLTLLSLILWNPCLMCAHFVLVCIFTCVRADSRRTVLVAVLLRIFAPWQMKSSVVLGEIMERCQPFVSEGCKFDSFNVLMSIWVCIGVNSFYYSSEPLSTFLSLDQLCCDTQGEFLSVSVSHKQDFNLFIFFMQKEWWKNLSPTLVC